MESGIVSLSKEEAEALFGKDSFGEESVNPSSNHTNMPLLPGFVERSIYDMESSEVYLARLERKLKRIEVRKQKGNYIVNKEKEEEWKLQQEIERGDKENESDSLISEINAKQLEEETEVRSLLDEDAPLLENKRTLYLANNAQTSNSSKCCTIT